MSSEPIVISSWPKNSRETLQVRLDTFKGQAIIDCRAWYAGSDGNLKPGRGGLTLSTRHLPQLADALAKALSMATTGDITPGNDSQNE